MSMALSALHSWNASFPSTAMNRVGVQRLDNGTYLAQVYALPHIICLGVYSSFQYASAALDVVEARLRCADVFVNECPELDKHSPEAASSWPEVVKKTSYAGIAKPMENVTDDVQHEQVELHPAIGMISPASATPNLSRQERRAAAHATAMAKTLSGHKDKTTSATGGAQTSPLSKLELSINGDVPMEQLDDGESAIHSSARPSTGAGRGSHGHGAGQDAHEDDSDDDAGASDDEGMTEYRDAARSRAGLHFGNNAVVTAKDLLRELSRVEPAVHTSETDGAGATAEGAGQKQADAGDMAVNVVTMANQAFPAEDSEDIIPRRGLIHEGAPWPSYPVYMATTELEDMFYVQEDAAVLVQDEHVWTGTPVALQQSAAAGLAPARAGGAGLPATICRAQPRQHASAGNSTGVQHAPRKRGDRIGPRNPGERLPGTAAPAVPGASASASATSNASKGSRKRARGNGQGGTASVSPAGLGPVKAKGRAGVASPAHIGHSAHEASLELGHQPLPLGLSLQAMEDAALESHEHTTDRLIWHTASAEFLSATNDMKCLFEDVQALTYWRGNAGWATAVADDEEDKGNNEAGERPEKRTQEVSDALAPVPYAGAARSLHVWRQAEAILPTALLTKDTTIAQGIAAKGYNDQTRVAVKRLLGAQRRLAPRHGYEQSTCDITKKTDPSELAQVGRITVWVPKQRFRLLEAPVVLAALDNGDEQSGVGAGATGATGASATDVEAAIPGARLMTITDGQATVPTITGGAMVDAVVSGSMASSDAVTANGASISVDGDPLAAAAVTQAAVVAVADTPGALDGPPAAEQLTGGMSTAKARGEETSITALLPEGLAAFSTVAASQVRDCAVAAYADKLQFHMARHGFGTGRMASRLGIGKDADLATWLAMCSLDEEPRAEMWPAKEKQDGAATPAQDASSTMMEDEQPMATARPTGPAQPSTPAAAPAPSRMGEASMPFALFVQISSRVARLIHDLRNHNFRINKRDSYKPLPWYAKAADGAKVLGVTLPPITASEDKVQSRKDRSGRAGAAATAGSIAASEAGAGAGAGSSMPSPMPDAASSSSSSEGDSNDGDTDDAASATTRSTGPAEPTGHLLSAQERRALMADEGAMNANDDARSVASASTIGRATIARRKFLKDGWLMVEAVSDRKREMQRQKERERLLKMKGRVLEGKEKEKALAKKAAKRAAKKARRAAALAAAAAGREAGERSEGDADVEDEGGSYQPRAGRKPRVTFQDDKSRTYKPSGLAASAVQAPARGVVADKGRKLASRVGPGGLGRIVSSTFEGEAQDLDGTHVDTDAATAAAFEHKRCTVCGLAREFTADDVSAAFARNGSNGSNNSAGSSSTAGPAVLPHKMLECGRCHVRVHEACYGLHGSNIEEPTWRCEECVAAVATTVKTSGKSASPEHKCRLCFQPTAGLASKRCKDAEGKPGFVHVICMATNHLVRYRFGGRYALEEPDLCHIGKAPPDSTAGGIGLCRVCGGQSKRHSLLPLECVKAPHGSSSGPCCGWIHASCALTHGWLTVSHHTYGSQPDLPGPDPTPADMAQGKWNTAVPVPPLLLQQPGFNGLHSGLGSHGTSVYNPALYSDLDVQDCPLPYDALIAYRCAPARRCEGFEDGEFQTALNDHKAILANSATMSVHPPGPIVRLYKTWPNSSTYKSMSEAEQQMLGAVVVPDGGASASGGSSSADGSGAAHKVVTQSHLQSAVLQQLGVVAKSNPKARIGIRPVLPSLFTYRLRCPAHAAGVQDKQRSVDRTRIVVGPRAGTLSGLVVPYWTTSAGGHVADGKLHLKELASDDALAAAATATAMQPDVVEAVATGAASGSAEAQRQTTAEGAGTSSTGAITDPAVAAKPSEPVANAVGPTCPAAADKPDPNLAKRAELLATRWPPGKPAEPLEAPVDEAKGGAAGAPAPGAVMTGGPVLQPFRQRAKPMKRSREQQAVASGTEGDGSGTDGAAGPASAERPKKPRASGDDADDAMEAVSGLDAIDGDTLALVQAAVDHPTNRGKDSIAKAADMLAVQVIIETKAASEGVSVDQARSSVFDAATGRMLPEVQAEVDEAAQQLQKTILVLLKQGKVCKPTVTGKAAASAGASGSAAVVEGATIGSSAAGVTNQAPADGAQSDDEDNASNDGKARGQAGSSAELLALMQRHLDEAGSVANACKTLSTDAEYTISASANLKAIEQRLYGMISKGKLTKPAKVVMAPASAVVTAEAGADGAAEDAAGTGASAGASSPGGQAGPSAEVLELMQWHIDEATGSIMRAAKGLSTDSGYVGASRLVKSIEARLYKLVSKGHPKVAKAASKDGAEGGAANDATAGASAGASSSGASAPVSASEQATVVLLQQHLDAAGGVVELAADGVSTDPAFVGNRKTASIERLIRKLMAEGQLVAREGAAPGATAAPASAPASSAPGPATESSSGAGASAMDVDTEAAIPAPKIPPMEESALIALFQAHLTSNNGDVIASAKAIAADPSYVGYSKDLKAVKWRLTNLIDKRKVKKPGLAKADDTGAAAGSAEAGTGASAGAGASASSAPADRRVEDAIMPSAAPSSSAAAPLRSAAASSRGAAGPAAASDAQRVASASSVPSAADSAVLETSSSAVAPGSAAATASGSTAGQPSEPATAAAGKASKKNGKAAASASSGGATGAEPVPAEPSGPSPAPATSSTSAPAAPAPAPVHSSSRSRRGAGAELWALPF